ncbi:type IV pilin [archaeon]|nr:MAG: type IV pilin [archaeon]
MRKGISPLVAVVLLIAITMTIAGVLAYWASGFVRGSLPASNTTTNLQQCSGSNFDILSASLNSTTGNMTVILQNKANVAVDIQNATFIYSNGTVYTFNIGQNLPAGNAIIGAILTGISPGYSSYQICSSCPGLCKP